MLGHRRHPFMHLGRETEAVESFLAKGTTQQCRDQATFDTTIPQFLWKNSIPVCLVGEKIALCFVQWRQQRLLNFFTIHLFSWLLIHPYPFYRINERRLTGIYVRVMEGNGSLIWCALSQGLQLCTTSYGHTRCRDHTNLHWHLDIPS